MQLSLKDRIPLYDTNKIGVIYAGPGQHENEAAILSNVCGSSRYTQFLAGLGTFLRLKDCPPAEIYTEGLDRNGAEGEFAYSWQYDICQGKKKLLFLNECLAGLEIESTSSARLGVQLVTVAQ